ncbi:ATP-dependent DNA helicase [Aureococcus anophagefferens]|nr:ATP-dependent DNA helicase [Aureococcus anophagefferens]
MGRGIQLGYEPDVIDLCGVDDAPTIGVDNAPTIDAYDSSSDDEPIALSAARKRLAPANAPAPTDAPRFAPASEAFDDSVAPPVDAFNDFSAGGMTFESFAPKKTKKPAAQKAAERKPKAEKKPAAAKRERGETAKAADAAKKTSKASRRHERVERNAKLRSGELALPKPVVDFDGARAATMLKMVRRGVDVHLPRGRPPYRSQLQVIDGALRAAEASRSAFLESPTGTGKTLAALAAALAWQRANYDATPTRVVWVARTHDQLQHAVREYERSCPYRPLMSLRLSRERFCLHPDIATAPNKAEACEEATKIQKNANKRGRFDVKNSGCGHLDTAEKIGYPQSQKMAAPLPPRREDERPDPGGRASLIFVTYQQLVEPITRRAGGLEQVFEDALVVVDEAHNLPQVARDAASYDVTEDRLADLVRTLEEFVPYLDEHDEAQAMLRSLIAPPGGDAPSEAPEDAAAAPKKKKKAKKRPLLFEATARGGPLVALLGWLRAAKDGDAAPLPPAAAARDGDARERVWGGAAAAELGRDVVGLRSADRVDENTKILWKLRKTLIDEGLESGAVRSDTINDLEQILVKLRYLLEPAAARHYRLICRSEPRGSVAMTQLTRGQRAAGLGEANYVRPARSLLMLSGTLRPCDLLAEELGLDLGPPDRLLPTRFAAAADENVGGGAAAPADDGPPLSQCRRARRGGNATAEPDAPATRRYYDALATALLGVASAAPHGVLVFFKSYRLLELALKRWTETGGLARLRAEKDVHVESRDLSGDSFDAMVAEYRAAAASARGALLLAIEHDGRDRGETWYRADAYRNVNQAAGRLIRHAKDFGALVLLDRALTANSMMSEWYADRLATLGGATELHNRLRAFFAAKNAGDGTRAAPCDLTGTAAAVPPSDAERAREARLQRFAA